MVTSIYLQQILLELLGDHMWKSPQKKKSQFLGQASVL